MKFDLHCHTKEGSIDSRIPVSKYTHYKIIDRLLGDDEIKLKIVKKAGGENANAARGDSKLR